MDKQLHAMQVLQRAVAQKLGRDEWVIELGPVLQISWMDADDPSKLNIVDVYPSDFRPFQVDAH